MSVPPGSFKKSKQQSEGDSINKYMERKLNQPGFFARTGWQTWMHLALHHPKDFPIPMQQYLDTVISPLLLPTPTNSLDLMMRAWYVCYGEGMFDSQLVPFGTKQESTQEQRREKKWESLTSSMSTSLTRHILNLPGSTIAGARSRVLPPSSGET